LQGHGSQAAALFPMTKMASHFKAAILEKGRNESDDRKRWCIHRRKDLEPFYCHSGESSSSSWRTILDSRFQLKLVLLAGFTLALQMGIYAVLANVLVYITAHKVPPDNPSYPGDILSANGTRSSPRNALYDTGFQLTPDLSYRPFWLKAVFVDMLVTCAQVLPPIVLLLTGQTANLVCYVASLSTLNLMKGVIQIATILPPARSGAACWSLNFPEDEIQRIRDTPLIDWVFTNWGMTHGCNDMLWSGHTSQTCLGVLFIDKTLRKLNVPFVIRGMLAVCFICYTIAVLACRMHYTIDVLVAALIAALLYTHTALRFSIWTYANRLVCNPRTYEESDSYMSSDEDVED